ncbi:hypothetical protein F383_33506 [Gossypium arboreum]|uniref:Uncharacterized protein n=1 Tax=Gossypium arboreum TaxID=29729 RepID=A0A0B0PPZ8_GOSAR|nr:hypothetical protein F383_33506 [Gossypium arboreum]
MVLHVNTLFLEFVRDFHIS